jgi:homocysteine S-methyltransferase
VPGLIIPDAIMARLEAAGDDAANEGVTIARELMAQMGPMVQGAYIIPAFGRYDLAAELVESVKAPAAG